MGRVWIDEVGYSSRHVVTLTVPATGTTAYFGPYANNSGTHWSYERPDPILLARRAHRLKNQKRDRLTWKSAREPITCINHAGRCIKRAKGANRPRDRLRHWPSLKERRQAWGIT